MKKLIALVLLLVLFPRTARADPIPAIPPGDDKIVPLKKGDPAPFSGQLFENNTAIRWGNWIEQYRTRLAVDIAFQQKLAQADLELCQKKAAVDQQASQKTIDDLKKRLAETEKKLEEPPWYKSNTLFFTLGAVSMASVVALTAWGLSSTKK